MHRNYERVAFASIKNRPGCLFIRTFFTEEFLYPLTLLKCLKLYA